MWDLWKGVHTKGVTGKSCFAVSWGKERRWTIVFLCHLWYFLQHQKCHEYSQIKVSQDRRNVRTYVDHTRGTKVTNRLLEKKLFNPGTRNNTRKQQAIAYRNTLRQKKTETYSKIIEKEI